VLAFDFMRLPLDALLWAPHAMDALNEAFPPDDDDDNNAEEDEEAEADHACPDGNDNAGAGAGAGAGKDGKHGATGAAAGGAATKKARTGGGRCRCRAPPTAADEYCATCEN